MKVLPSLSGFIKITLPSENNRNKVSNKDKYSFNTYLSVAALNDVVKEKQYSGLTIIMKSLFGKSLIHRDILSVIVVLMILQVHEVKIII